MLSERQKENEGKEEFLEFVFKELMAISKGTCTLDEEAFEKANNQDQLQVLEGLIYLNEDIELYKAELDAKMVALEKKNEELAQFNYIASHDLQEPLRTVTSFSKLLAKENKDVLNETGLEYLDFILQASERMQQLIMELLDYSRIGRDKVLMDIDCNRVVELVLLDMSARTNEDNAQVEIGELPTIKGYKMEMRQLFQNLLSNALKFSKKDETPRIKISSQREDSHWLFKIEDNGIGIAERHLHKIFGIFQRLHSRKKYEGTGIGLAHCKKIVEIHNGEIWVDSEKGKGSTFYFTIPFNY